jgi:DNA-binding MarR family transcriptional regulator
MGDNHSCLVILRILCPVARNGGTGASCTLSEEKASPKNIAGKKPLISSDGAMDDALKSLGTQFNDPSLKSSTRVLILFSLALNGKLGFADLINLTGTGKGSLSNHLEKLEASGYIITKSIMTFSGPRIVAEITEKGLQSYNELLGLLKKLGK